LPRRASIVVTLRSVPMAASAERASSRPCDSQDRARRDGEYAERPNNRDLGDESNYRDLIVRVLPSSGINRFAQASA
jgi:hypothetical protein